MMGASTHSTYWVCLRCIRLGLVCVMESLYAAVFFHAVSKLALPACFACGDFTGGRSFDDERVSDFLSWEAGAGPGIDAGFDSARRARPRTGIPLYKS